MPIVRSVCTLACAAVLTSACTDSTPLAPRPNLTRPITASMMSPVAARSHPNSEKYRDSGFQPATGRSGSATVSTRALLDKAGTTDVEVTTGRSEEHTSELQSPYDLVCRLLLEKKTPDKKNYH